MGKKKSTSQSIRTPLHRHLKTMAPYPPGRPIEDIQREYGLDDVVKLASNENPLGPSPHAVKAMQVTSAEMNLYPDGDGYRLKQALAKNLGVGPEEIVLGAGSDEITTLLAQCYLGPGRSIVTSKYSFIRYAMAARVMDAPIRLAPMKRFRHDSSALAGAVGRSTKLLFIDNPCNPTGAMMTRRELTRLLNSVPERVLVVVDEAYYEYARSDPNYPDTLDLWRRFPNLIITRTFSKAYGLAGLRIGYGIARPEIVNDLNRVRSPFNTNRMAQAAAVAALDDRVHLRRSIATNDKGKIYLEGELKALELRCVRTWANFILTDFTPRGRTGSEIYEALLRRGIIVRPMAGYGLNGCARISIGTPAGNRKLIRALKSVLDK